MGGQQFSANVGSGQARKSVSVELDVVHERGERSGQGRAWSALRRSGRSLLALYAGKQILVSHADIKRLSFTGDRLGGSAHTRRAELLERRCREQGVPLEARRAVSLLIMKQVEELAKKPIPKGPGIVTIAVKEEPQTLVARSHTEPRIALSPLARPTLRAAPTDVHLALGKATVRAEAVSALLSAAVEVEKQCKVRTCWTYAKDVRVDLDAERLLSLQQTLEALREAGVEKPQGERSEHERRLIGETIAASAKALGVRPHALLALLAGDGRWHSRALSPV